MDTDFDNYDSLEDYFADHPDEEEEFIEEMARLDAEKELVDYPEDWPMYKYA